jgi:hypothetical protein
MPCAFILTCHNVVASWMNLQGTNQNYSFDLGKIPTTFLLLSIGKITSIFVAGYGSIWPSNCRFRPSRNGNYSCRCRTWISKLNFLVLYMGQFTDIINIKFKLTLIFLCQIHQEISSGMTANKRTWKVTSTELCEILYTDSQEMLLLSSIVASCYFAVYKTENTAVRIRCADHETPLYPQKLALTSPTSGGRSVGIVCLRTKATEL